MFTDIFKDSKLKNCRIHKMCLPMLRRQITTFQWQCFLNHLNHIVSPSESKFFPVMNDVNIPARAVADLISQLIFLFLTFC